VQAQGERQQQDGRKRNMTNDLARTPRGGA